MAYDDVIAAQVARGADLVVVQTSNAMFLGTPQLEQQFAITRVRALEVGRAVVVASVNGLSGAVGSDGQVLAKLPAEDTATFVVELPLLDGLTPAVRLGNRFALAAYALVAASLIAGDVGVSCRVGVADPGRLVDAFPPGQPGEVLVVLGQLPVPVAGLAAGRTGRVRAGPRAPTRRPGRPASSANG